MPACLNCGADNLEQDQFCHKCGLELYESTDILKSDTIFESRYFINKIIGRGGMGNVYLALDQRLTNTPVAIKEMSSRALGVTGDLKAAVAAFKKEATMLNNLRHPSFPRVIDFFSKGEDRWYLVMDYIKGQTLNQVLRKYGKIPEEEVIVWSRQLCEILEFLHSQNPPIIFRDLKPSNIMLTEDGVIKLIDFGIARHFRPENSQDTRAIGTEGYVPPEQYGKKQTDARSDIFALGVTLHQLLTGKDPGKNPLTFEKPSKFTNVSARLENAIMKAIEIKPEDRPQTAQEMLSLIGKGDVKNNNLGKDQMVSIESELTEVLEELVLDDTTERQKTVATNVSNTSKMSGLDQYLPKTKQGVVPDTVYNNNKHQPPVNASSKNSKKSGKGKFITIVAIFLLVLSGGAFAYLRYGDMLGIMLGTKPSSLALTEQTMTDTVSTKEVKTIEGANVQEGNFQDMISQTSNGNYVAYYLFDGTEGQQVQVEALSTDFDSYLELLRPDGSLLTSDNNSGGNRNAKIVFILPASGRYTVKVTQTERAIGKYTVQANVKLEPDESTAKQNQAEPPPVFTIEARFENIITQTKDGKYLAYYEFQGSEGRQLRLEMKSLDFDSLLELLRPDGSQLAVDYNSGGDRNARIEFNLPSNGKYIIVATQENRMAGAYSLQANMELVADKNTKIQNNNPPPTIYTVDGVFNNSSQTADDKFVNLFTFYGEQGQQIRVEMDSLEVDSYLEILRPDGTSMVRDYNLAGNRNARIEENLSLSGNYVLKASEEKRATGNFTIKSNLPLNVK